MWFSSRETDLAPPVMEIRITNEVLSVIEPVMEPIDFSM